MQPNKTVYLDQCVISELRAGKPHSEALRAEISRREDCAFVYSDVHVREILLSGNHLPYIEALEDIGAYYLPLVDMVEELSTRSAAVIPDVVRQKIPQEIDACVAAQITLEKLGRIFAPLHSAGGKMSLENESETVIADFAAYLGGVEQELRAIASPDFDIDLILVQLQQGQRSVEENIRSLDTHKLHKEAHEFHETFSRLLAKEKLDDIPDREIAAFLIGKSPEAFRIRDTYPEGFGCKALSSGAVTGFAHLLFTLGVGKFKRPMKSGSENFVRRLSNQYRDCEHIEQAIRCHVFMTSDDGAAKLARAVYSYAGVPNEVILLRTE